MVESARLGGVRDLGVDHVKQSEVYKPVGN
jgi:hypothetical protein